MTFPRRGEIYLVEFDPARGHEIKKTRPALVIQNDIGNRHNSVTIVAAITSTVSAHPVMVAIAPTKTNGLSAPSTIHLGQLRSVDRQRLIKRLGVVDQTTMRRVDDALRIMAWWGFNARLRPAIARDPLRRVRLTVFQTNTRGRKLC